MLSLPIPGIVSTGGPRLTQGYSCSKAITQEYGKEVFEHLKIFLVHIPICTDMTGSKDFTSPIFSFAFFSKSIHRKVNICLEHINSELLQTYSKTEKDKTKMS
jgi:hypothetical protein